MTIEQLEERIDKLGQQVETSLKLETSVINALKETNETLRASNKSWQSQRDERIRFLNVAIGMVGLIFVASQGLGIYRGFRLEVAQARLIHS